MIPKENSLNSLNSFNDYDDIEQWAEEQWLNWPDIDSDLNFEFDYVDCQFKSVRAYFSYWKFRIDLRLDPPFFIKYPVELMISIDNNPEGDSQ